MLNSCWLGMALNGFYVNHNFHIEHTFRHLRWFHYFDVKKRRTLRQSEKGGFLYFQSFDIVWAERDLLCLNKYRASLTRKIQKIALHTLTVTSAVTWKHVWLVVANVFSRIYWINQVINSRTVTVSIIPNISTPSTANASLQAANKQAKWIESEALFVVFYFVYASCFLLFDLLCVSKCIPLINV